MLIIDYTGSYYKQRCFLVDDISNKRIQRSFHNFIVDTGAPHTSCTYKCVNPALKEEDIEKNFRFEFFGGYVGGTGIKHYLYPVDNFYVGSIDLGKQEVWITFDDRASANLLGSDLLQELTFLQHKDSKQLLIFRNKDDFINYLSDNQNLLLELIKHSFSSISSKDKRSIADFVFSNLESSDSDDYPILEFDDNKTAILNPESFGEQPFKTDKLIITFFPEVMDKLVAEGKITLERTIGGENPVLIYRFVDADILITLGFVGCPSCAGNLDLFNAMGITKVMFCGGGGVLDKNIEVGQVLVVDGAIRDEGFSYHYIPPSRYIYTNPKTTEKITRYLEENSVSYIRGLTWTTDAVFRETSDKIARRKEEGAKIVEMEQAGCIAVSQDEWSNRSWRSREGIRYDLVMLCRKLVEII